MIHPTAIVDPGARIGANVTIGAYAVIGADVEIGEGTVIGPQVVIQGPTRIGRDNQFHAFASIGGPPQHRSFRGEITRLEIGDGNLIREHCTINRGTAEGGGITSLQDDNFIMAGVHIAHDCRVGSHNTFANNATLAGHVLVGDYVTFSGFVGVHQFCRIGSYAMLGPAAIAVKDVPPYVMAAGNFAEPRGLNVRGLKRRGFSEEAVRRVNSAYKLVFRSGATLEEAIEQLSAMAGEAAEVAPFLAFIRESARGIIR